MIQHLISRSKALDSILAPKEKTKKGEGINMVGFRDWKS